MMEAKAYMQYDGIQFYGVDDVLQELYGDDQPAYTDSWEGIFTEENPHYNVYFI